MRIPLTIVLGGLLATPLHAAELTVDVEIPRLTVAEYRQPSPAPHTSPLRFPRFRTLLLLVLRLWARLIW